MDKRAPRPSHHSPCLGLAPRPAGTLIGLADCLAMSRGYILEQPRRFCSFREKLAFRGSPIVRNADRSSSVHPTRFSWKAQSLSLSLSL